MDAAVFVAAFILALAAPAVLYVLVQAEAENTRRMDRETAERTVRRDTDDPPTDPPDGERIDYRD